MLYLLNQLRRMGKYYFTESKNDFGLKDCIMSFQGHNSNILKHVTRKLQSVGIEN
jgi:hypothetical protein